MLWAVLLQAKMDPKIFIHSTRSLTIRLNMPLHLEPCPRCFQWAINLWGEVQKLLHPIFSPSMLAYMCKCVCVLIVVWRSFNLIPCKYWRAEGVKRVRTAGPPAIWFCWGRNCWLTLHSCSECLACSIMVFGDPRATKSTVDFQSFKACSGVIPYVTLFTVKTSLEIKRQNLVSGAERYQIPLVINLQDMTALFAGFSGCVCFQFLSGNWSETSLQKTAWKH